MRTLVGEAVGARTEPAEPRGQVQAIRHGVDHRDDAHTDQPHARQEQRCGHTQSILSDTGPSGPRHVEQLEGCLCIYSSGSDPTRTPAREDAGPPVIARDLSEKSQRSQATAGRLCADVRHQHFRKKRQPDADTHVEERTSVSRGHCHVPVVHRGTKQSSENGLEATRNGRLRVDIREACACDRHVGSEVGH